MNVTDILRRAAGLRVRMYLVGDKVRIVGPASAVDELTPEMAAHKPEIVAHLRAVADGRGDVPADCVGALREPDGGLFLPWGPNLSAEDVRRLRAELAASIDSLATLEGWPGELRDNIMSRAMGGPLADLLPNFHHFRERLAVAADEQAARAALDARAWKYDPARRGR